MATERTGSLSGLTETEAREFHGLFMSGFIGFTAAFPGRAGVAR
jgi:light-harvesting complex 1 beta chain